MLKRKLYIPSSTVLHMITATFWPFALAIRGTFNAKAIAARDKTPSIDHPRLSEHGGTSDKNDTKDLQIAAIICDSIPYWEENPAAK